MIKPVPSGEHEGTGHVQLPKREKYRNDPAAPSEAPHSDRGVAPTPTAQGQSLNSARVTGGQRWLQQEGDSRQNGVRNAKGLPGSY